MASKIAGYIGKLDPGNGTQYSLGSTAYGVCETAAETAEKTVDMTGFTLIEGATVFIKFTNANSASNPTLSINGSTAKPIVQYGTTAVGTAAETTGWRAGAIVCLTYDGTSWVRDQGYNTNSTYYYESVYVTTASGTAAKVGTCSNFGLQKGHLQVLLMNANTAASAITLNINSTGAKPIYINGVASSASNYTLPKAMYLVYYDGANYYFRTDGKITGDITGNAATATSATGFSSAKTIALTGNVTGSATGGNGSNGWSIATTIGTGVVTNAMLAGSIANGKLANSSMSIAGNSVSLGGSLAADTLRTSLGLSNAMHFIGVATVAITDGSTTNPTISGYDFTADRKPGDVIIDSDTSYEYVWTYEGKWERLGPDGSYKIIQSAVSSPSASGNATAFIDTISQDENGVITVTKKNLDTSGTWSGKLDKTFKVKLNNTQYTYDGSADVDLSTIYAPTAGGTANTQALVGNGATATPKWVNISPSVSITAGTSSATPKVNVTVLGQSGTAQAITTATTEVYGATKLTDAYTSTDATLATTGKSILAAIQTLDVSDVGGGTGEYISKISETDGKIVATKTTTTVSNTWTDGTTNGPTIKTTVNDIDGTAVAIPSASASVSGVVTTAAQTFAGDKTFQGNVFPAVSDSYSLGSTALRWKFLYGVRGIDLTNAGATGITVNNTDIVHSSSYKVDATGLAGIYDDSHAFWVLSTDQPYGDTWLKSKANRNIIFERNGTENARFDITGHFIPGTTETYNLGSTTKYWNNAYIKNIIYSSGEANRLVWTDSDKLLKATNHYADATSIAINSTTIPTPPTDYPTYNLYINGDARSSGDLYFEGTNNKLAAFKLTTVGTVSRANIDMGWDWERLDGAGAAFRSTDPNLAANQIGRFVLFARTTADDTAQLVGAPTGELSWKKASGAARIGINADANANYNLYVNGSQKIDSGSLQVYPIGGSYNDGIRIHTRSSDNNWAGLMLCGTDNTGDTGTSANSWFIANNNGNFYITRNGSTSSSSAMLACVNNVWSWNGTATGNISGNAGTATYWQNRGGATVSIGDSSWALQLTPSGQTNRATVWSQKWSQSGLTYTPSGGSATANTDTADLKFWLSSGNAANTLQVNMQIDGKIYAANGFKGALEGNASTATTLQTARTINGTSFNGSANITTANWGTARTITIGSKGKSVNGSANVSWSLAEIGATVSNAWTAGTTAGPTIKTTVNGVTGTAVAIPTATASASGVVTTGEQTFGGKKIFNTEATFSSANGFRLTQGNYGVIFRNDGSGFYILLTASGSAATGSWTSARPLTITNSTGVCSINGNAATASQIYSSASTTKAYVLGTTTASSANHATVYNASVYTSGSVLYGAAWNDYAEYRITKEKIEPGRCVKEVGDDTLEITTKRLERGCEIVSDTFGFAIGETEESKTPIASSGRVLAYLYEGQEIAKTHIGWPVCSGPNGTVSIMTEEEEEKYPSRIIGTISAVPDYEEWGTGNVKVNGRVWIRIR